MSRNTIKNPRGGLVLKVNGFDELKKIWEKYKPKANLTDFELNEFIANKLNNDSKFKLEDYLKLELNAWADFKRRYPYADPKTFKGEYHNKSFNIYYKHTPIEVIGDHPASTFYDNVEAALSPAGSFPFTLLPTNLKYPIPGTPYNKKPAPVLHEFKISVAPGGSFFAKFRNIFKNNTITFHSAAQSRRWLNGPDFNYWPQQLNFAVWCATSGCGISLNEKYPKRVQQFINFHVYFTIRRILYEMRISLPDDSIFQQIGNHYNMVSYQRLCQEFNLPENPDFRWRGGMNSGLGTIYIRNGGTGRWLVPPVSNGLVNWPNRSPIFTDEHGIGGQVGEIYNITHNGKQHEWFSPYLGKGITKTGMGRLNRSVEAFVYCIVGAEVNVKTSIVDSGGGGQETQQEMLKLFEEAVLVEDIASGVQRYQLAIQEAHLRLDFAIAPNIWLIPSNLVINTESKIGYNNFLQKAKYSMTFGQNETVNEPIHDVGKKHNLGKKKTSLPTLKKNPPKITKSNNRIINKNIPLKNKEEEKENEEEKEEEKPKPPVKPFSSFSKKVNTHEIQIATVSIFAAVVGFYFLK